MTDKHQRDAMRSWPTHEMHGEPGFVTCRRSILEAVLDELEAAEDKQREWYEADGTITRLAPHEVVARRIAAAKRLAELESMLVARDARVNELCQQVEKLGGVLMTARPSNTPEWMEYVDQVVADASLVLARTDDLGALQSVLERTIDAADEGACHGECMGFGARTPGERAAILARMMRRAGEAPAKPVLGPYEITKGRVVPNEPKSGPYPRRAGEPS